MVVDINGVSYRAEGYYELVTRKDLLLTMAVPAFVIDPDDLHLKNKRWGAEPVLTIEIARYDNQWVSITGSTGNHNPVGKVRDFFNRKTVLFENPISQCVKLNDIDLMELELTFDVIRRTD